MYEKSKQTVPSLDLWLKEAKAEPAAADSSMLVFRAVIALSCSSVHWGMGISS